MFHKLAFCIGATVLVGVSGVALSQDMRKSESIKRVESAALSDQDLKRMGIRSLTAADVEKMRITLGLLERARASGGTRGGLNYSCESTTNVCKCDGMFDCIDMIRDCRTPPRNPDGSLCTGGKCSCTWH